MANRAHLALLQNKDGYFVDATEGASFALSEYQASLGHDDNVLPHNMHGRVSWPLIGLLCLMLPNEIDSCKQLKVMEDFVSLLLIA